MGLRFFLKVCNFLRLQIDLSKSGGGTHRRYSGLQALFFMQGEDIVYIDVSDAITIGGKKRLIADILGATLDTVIES